MSLTKTKDLFPENCDVQEITGDGRPVGRCWFYLKDGVCPRHGVRKYGRQMNNGLLLVRGGLIQMIQTRKTRRRPPRIEGGIIYPCLGGLRNVHKVKDITGY